MQYCKHTVWCTNLSSIFKHKIWYQFTSATASSVILLKSWMEHSGEYYFCSVTDACLPHKENNGKEHCSCSRFTIIMSKAEQENKNVTFVILSEPVHGGAMSGICLCTVTCLHVYTSWQESVEYICLTIARWWRPVLIDTVSQSSAPLPPNITLASPLICLPLQRNEGQRARGACVAHMLCWKTSPPVSKSLTWQRNMSGVRIPQLYQHWRWPSQGEISKHCTHEQKVFFFFKKGEKWMLDKRNASERVLV